MLDKLKKILLYVTLFYSILGFLVIPLVLKPQLIDVVQKQTNAKINIDDVYFNPFTFRLELSEIKLSSLDDKELLFIKRMILNTQVSSLFRGAIHIKDFILEEPRISLVLDKEKKINFTSIIKKSPQKSDSGTSGDIPRIIVDTIAIVEGNLNYEDYTRESKFEFGLDSIGFELKNIDTKDLTASDAQIRFYTLLADGGFVDFKSEVIGFEPLVIKGNLDFEASKLYTQWRYMKDSLNLEVADGRLSLNTDYYFNLDNLEATTLSNLNVALNKLRVKPKGPNKDVLNINSLYIQEGTIKPFKQSVHLKKIALESMDIKIKRDKKGKIDWMEYIKTAPKDSDKADTKEMSVAKEETKPWNLTIDNIALENIKASLNDRAFNATVSLAALDLDEIALNTKSKEQDFKATLKKMLLKESEIIFEDKTLARRVTNRINNINVTATDINSSKDSWLEYSLDAKVNNRGVVKSSGSIRHTPLKQNGSFELYKISLKELSPYIKEHAYAYIKGGYLSLKTKTQYSKSRKKPDLRVNGSFKLEKFFLNDSRDRSSLISFNKVDMKKFTLETSPNRLYIDNINLNSFYVSAIIDKNKTMNLASLAKVNKSKKKKVKSKAKKSKPFPVKIAKINVAHGRAFFADLSLPIEFKTNIHDLNGEINSVSNISGETSHIDIAGEIDKYGSTKLKGSVNAGDPKAFTDISFNFRNLDLSAMSGYSGSFAGYKIDDGKLFLNLNYNILESNLIAENSIIIKNIKLGDVMENETNSTLPLGFAIALLEDSDGVIDIDMPVRGNLNEPDFKYGALVLKTFAKLILKAIASPFSILGSILGVDGDKLKYAEFKSGSAEILLSEQEKLDNIAKLMVKRPKISLNIGGTYDADNDKTSIQKAKLINLVAKLSGAKNEKERKSAMSIDLLEDIYEDTIGNDDKIEIIEDALDEKYDGDEYKRAYLQALVKECSAIQKVTLDEVKELAHQRSLMIKEYLVDIKGVEMSRVNELDISEASADENKLIKTKLEVVVK